MGPALPESDMPRLPLLALLLLPAAVAAPVPRAGKPQLVVVTTDAESGKSQLVLVDDDGKNPKPLTDAAGNASFPAWSPDGKKLAYVRHKGGGKAEVVVADADGKNEAVVLKDLTPVGGGRPAWRPR
jgi:Tol biopolymer transport system component